MFILITEHDKQKHKNVSTAVTDISEDNNFVTDSITAC